MEGKSIVHSNVYFGRLLDIGSKTSSYSLLFLLSILCQLCGKVHMLAYLEEPSNVTASLNEVVMLTCKVEGLATNQSIVWEKDGLIISIDEFLHVDVGDSVFTVELNRETGEYKLTITNIKLEESGNYRCGVQVDNGKYWSAIGILTVLRYINYQPNDIAVFEGESVTLSCAAHIDIYVQSLVWAKDSEIFAYNDSIVDVNLATRVSFTGDVTRGEYNITITIVSEQDTGRYRCGVETESGDIEWSRLAWLTVLEFTQIEQRKESVLENEKHVLQCRVTEMQPGQDLVWHKDETLIAINEYVLYSTDNGNLRVIIEANSSYYNMKFKSAELADSGEYKCGVEFPNGEYFWFSAIKFTVIGEEMLEFPSTTVGTNFSSKYLTSEYSTVMTTTGYEPEQTWSTTSRQETTTGTFFKTLSMKPRTTIGPTSRRASIRMTVSKTDNNYDETHATSVSDVNPIKGRPFTMTLVSEPDMMTDNVRPTVKETEELASSILYDVLTAAHNPSRSTFSSVVTKTAKWFSSTENVALFTPTQKEPQSSPTTAPPRIKSRTDFNNVVIVVSVAAASALIVITLIICWTKRYYRQRKRPPSEVNLNNDGVAAPDAATHGQSEERLHSNLAVEFTAAVDLMDDRSRVNERDYVNYVRPYDVVELYETKIRPRDVIVTDGYTKLVPPYEKDGKSYSDDKI